MLGKTKLTLLAIAPLLLLPRLDGAQCRTAFSSTICSAEERIYINTDKKLGALDLTRGDIQWQIDLPPRDESYAATAATKDVVAVWAGFPNTGIYAFDANTGESAWRINTSSYGMTAVGRYFVFSDAEHWEALTAVDDRTGKRIWHYSGNRPTRGGVSMLVAADEGILTELFAIDGHSGQILERWPKAWAVSAAALGDKLIIIGTRYAEGKTNKVAAYSLPGYEMRWVRNNPEGREVAGIAADADRVFTAVYPREWELLRPGQAELVLMKASSGDVIWTKTIRSGGLLDSPVALVQGIAIFVTWDSPSSGVVQGFDAATGQLKWTAHSDHKLMGGVVCAGSRCYIDAEPGQVLAVDAQSGAQRWYRIPPQ